MTKIFVTSFPPSVVATWQQSAADFLETIRGVRWISIRPENLVVPSCYRGADPPEKFHLLPILIAVADEDHLNLRPEIGMPASLHQISVRPPTNEMEPGSFTPLRPVFNRVSVVTHTLADDVSQCSSK